MTSRGYLLLLLLLLLRYDTGRSIMCRERYAPVQVKNRDKDGALKSNAVVIKILKSLKTGKSIKVLVYRAHRRHTAGAAQPRCLCGILGCHHIHVSIREFFH